MSEPDSLRPVGSAERQPALAVRARRGSRERILSAIRAAAITEFSLYGLNGTSTQAIARRAGLTKPQLHYYIAGKEELYSELLHSVMQDWKIAFVPAGWTDPAAILERYVRIKLDHAFRHPEVSRIFTREILDGGPNLDRYWANTRSWVQGEVDVIQRWIDEGRMPPQDPRLLLMHIWATTQHHADFALQIQALNAGAADREAIAAELVRFVLAGCGLRPA
jgi:TetR/AcrR family transcriptional regulator